MNFRPKASVQKDSVGRIHGFDLFRGIFLMVMTLDHLTSPTGLFKSFNWLSGDYTYNPFGYATAAEGFVLLSGVVAGLVYCKILDRKGFRFTRNKAFRRAFDLYKVTVLCCLTIGFCALVFSSWTSNWNGHLNLPVYADKPWVSLLSFLVAYLPSYVEILPMYGWFLVFMPFVLLAFNQDSGRSKIFLTFAILLLSAASWIYGQSFPYRSLSRWLGGQVFQTWQIPIPIHLGWFDIFSWQLLFVLGLFFGSSIKKGSRWVPYALRSKLLLTVCLSIALVGFLSRHGIVLKQLSWHDPRITVPVLGWFRVLNVLAQLYLFTLLLRHLPFLSRSKPLEFLGRSSLQVCAFQAVGCHVVLLLFKGQVIQLPYFLQGILLVLCMGSLFIPAAYHQYEWKKKCVAWLKNLLKQKQPKDFLSTLPTENQKGK